MEQESLQAQVAAAHDTSAVAEAGARQLAIDLAAERKRADAAQDKVRTAQSQLAAAVEEAQAAKEVAAREAPTTAERQQRVQGDLDAAVKRLGVVQQRADSLHDQVKALLAAAPGAGQELPSAPTGEGFWQWFLPSSWL